MDNPTQQQIDTIILQINNAEDPATVTNIMVATVFAFLADKVKTMSTMSDLNNEASARQNSDMALDARITALQTTLNTLMNGNVTDAIESFNEVINFLSEVTDDETLTGLLNQINIRLANAEDDIDAKADLNLHTSKILYAQMPDVVLASMGTTLDNVNNDSGIPVSYHPSEGSTYWDENTQKIIFVDNTGTSRDMGSPRPGLIYCNKMSNLTYRWNGIEGWRQVGGNPGDGSGDEGLTAYFDSTALVITTADAPAIKTNRSSIEFGNVEQNDSKTVSLAITGKNLTSGITIALSQTSNAFVCHTSSISAANANQTNTIDIIFAPSAFGSHSATLTLTSGSTTRTIPITANCVEEIVPAININDGLNASIAAASSDTATMPIQVTAVYLQPFEVVSFAVSGASGMSISPATLTADENGYINEPLTLTYEAGESDETGTLTASCESVSSTSIAVSGHVAVRLNEGDYFEIGGVRYTVLSNTSNVSAKAGSLFVGSQDVNIPASVNDTGLTVYDSGGTAKSASGLNYNVKELADSAFIGKTLGNVKVDEGVGTLHFRAFSGTNSTQYGIGTVELPSTTLFGVKNSYSQQFFNRPVRYLTIHGCGQWQTQIFFTAVRRLVLGERITSCNKANVFSGGIEENGTVECLATTPPTLNSTFFGNNALTNVTLYVPDESVSAYQADTNWSAVFGSANIKGLSQKPSNN